jgi:dynein light intermediate chain 2
MDLWDLADTIDLAVPQSDSDSTVFFVGSSKVGKSTIIQNFLKPSNKKEPKATFSLEYNYARKKLANGKALAHIWEMGGDINEPKLMNVPVTPATLEALTAVVCVDLSKPHNVLSHSRHWVRQLRSSIEASFAQLRAERNDKLQDMVRASKAPFVEHVDNGRVKPSPVPLIVMATKYDTLRAGSVSTAERRLIFQALRFVAHYYGGTLLCSGGDSASLRGVLATVCFQGAKALKPTRETSPDKMVCVTVGQDSYDAILGTGGAGTDAGTDADASPSKAARLAGVLDEGATGPPDDRSWKALARMLEDAFGPADKATSDAANAGADNDKASGFDTDMNTGKENSANEYPEAEVDEERAKRQVVLERYVAEEERKEALLKKMARASAPTQAPAAVPANRDDGARGARIPSRGSRDALDSGAREEEKSYRK